MGAAAEWVGSGPVAPAATAFGGRQQWLDYSFQTTGFGSVERCGEAAHRATVVRPATTTACGGREHVLDREALTRTRADVRGSWLTASLGVAWWCATDDEVAGLVGPTLHQMLWTGRHDLGHPDVVGGLVDLWSAAARLAHERRLFLRATWHDEVGSVRLESRALSELRREWAATAGPTPSS